MREISKKKIKKQVLLIKDHRNKYSEINEEEFNIYKGKILDNKLSLLTDEIPSLKEYFEYLKNDNVYLFFSSDTLFELEINPIIGLEYTRVDNINNSKTWGGFSVEGSITNNIEYFINFRDIIEKTAQKRNKKNITREMGYAPRMQDESITDYSIVHAGVLYRWDWGEFNIIKSNLSLGSGYSSSIILSEKAPSYPYVTLSIYPSTWIEFSWYHGFLKSGITDSNSIRFNKVIERPSFDDVPKYIVGHYVSLFPIPELRISFGESIIYSDAIEPIYFIPVMFYRAADHYNSSLGVNSGDNAQIYFDINYLINKISTNIYLSLFIDEFSFSKIIEGNNPSAIAYTLGGKIIDPLLRNSSIVFEYNRLNPFVYMNSNDAQTYSSHGYQLGHWLGSNGHEYFVEYEQFLQGRIYLSTFLSYSVKGKTEIPKEQYSLPYPKFLYGAKRYQLEYEIKITYAFSNRMKAILKYNSTDIKDEELFRTPGQSFGLKNAVSFALFFGL